MCGGGGGGGGGTYVYRCVSVCVHSFRKIIVIISG